MSAIWKSSERGWAAASGRERQFPAEAPGTPRSTNAKQDLKQLVPTDLLSFDEEQRARDHPYHLRIWRLGSECRTIPKLLNQAKRASPRADSGWRA